jgi:hypothetical protein
MELWERSRHINRIISGQMRLSINQEIFYIKTPTRIQRCIAEEIFHDHFDQAELSGAFTEDELLDFLNKKNIWQEDDDNILKILERDIENLKVGLYQLITKTNERKSVRKALEKAKVEHQRLLILRHSYDHITCLGIATSARRRYLLGCSIYNSNGEAYWDENGWEQPDGLLDKVMFKISQNEIIETQYRELACHDPWSSIWSANKYCGGRVFDVAAVDLSDEQRILLNWSDLYDSIRSHPDSPGEDVFNDDDMLDGWLIIQRRRRQENQAQKDGDRFLNNEKIRNAGEVFVPVDSLEGAQRVHQMNDAIAKMNLKEKFGVINKVGEEGIQEQHMPDTHRKKQEAMMANFVRHAKGK